tara:strand:- start:36 stop:440 length:405 start_codon:yes stop_codon:yes gene_type:complete
MLSSQITKKNPRVIVIQKLYTKELNFDSKIEFQKHRYKKFIKDIVLGTIERKDLIEENVKKYLGSDINIKRTEKMLLILLHAAIFEIMYKPQTNVNIIINEYLNAANFFIDSNQKKFLNALLDKISKKLRYSNE